MSAKICKACGCYVGTNSFECGECKRQSESPTPTGSASDVNTAGNEVWDVFVRHNLTYEQGLNIMAATVKMLGRKTGDEVGAFCAFLSKAIKICPALADVPGKPGDETPNSVIQHQK